MSSIGLRTSVAFTAVALLAAQPAGTFHLATSAAEKELDSLLRAEAGSSVMHASPRHFTAALRAAWRSAERAAIRKNCGGKEIPGEACGLDFDPFLCAQDTAEPYRYRTVQADSKSALLEVLGTAPDAVVVGYRLVRVRKHWLVDGVKCDEHSLFHWK